MSSDLESDATITSRSGYALPNRLILLFHGIFCLFYDNVGPMSCDQLPPRSPVIVSSPTFPYPSSPHLHHPSTSASIFLSFSPPHPSSSLFSSPVCYSSLLMTCPYHFNPDSCTFLDFSPTFAAEVRCPSNCFIPYSVHLISTTSFLPHVLSSLPMYQPC